MPHRIRQNNFQLWVSLHLCHFSALWQVVPAIFSDALSQVFHLMLHMIFTHSEWYPQWTKISILSNCTLALGLFPHYHSFHCLLLVFSLCYMVCTIFMWKELNEGLYTIFTLPKPIPINGNSWFQLIQDADKILSPREWELRSSPITCFEMSKMDGWQKVRGAGSAQKKKIATVSII